jgi:hypothetical protein
MRKMTGNETRRVALENVASRGGSENERRQAARHLANGTGGTRKVGGLALNTEDRWQPLGTIVRTRPTLSAPDGANSYLRGTALAFFLKHIKENVQFNARTIPQIDKIFGVGDFYVILNWLLQHNLATKYGSKYEVHDFDAVRAAWNAACDAMKL